MILSSSKLLEFQKVFSEVTLLLFKNRKEKTYLLLHVQLGLLHHFSQNISYSILSPVFFPFICQLYLKEQIYVISRNLLTFSVNILVIHSSKSFEKN